LISHSFDGLTCRKKKAALQKFDTKSLKEYKDPDGETYRGIEWGVKEIFDIFSPLSSIAEVVSVKVSALFPSDY